jgi:hypothetical protein
VRGEYQGAAFLFRQRSAAAGLREDGTLSGHDQPRLAASADDGIARIRWTGRALMECARTCCRRFEVEFTRPENSRAPGNVELSRYDYDWWWRGCLSARPRCFTSARCRRPAHVR